MLVFTSTTSEISTTFVQPHDQNAPEKISEMSPAGYIHGKAAQLLTKEQVA